MSNKASSAFLNDWQKRFLTAALILLCAFAVAACSSGSSSDENTPIGDTGGNDGSGNGGGDVAKLIPIPIEVFGPSGSSETIEFDLDSSGDITHLYLRCNACGYDHRDLDGDPDRVKAAVRINGGDPIPLKHYAGGDDRTVIGNQDIEMLGPEAAYGGIGGGFRTVRFTVPVTGLLNGSNTITFEHVEAAGFSMGFRIIELNLLRNGDTAQTVFTDSDIEHDDPSTWQPPLNNAADIEAGRELWTRRNALYDEGLDLLDGAGNGEGSVSGQMIASCADCHARDGRDLQYFNFSNHSIAQRAVFHRLSETEGDQIASYIRSLDIPYVAQARPWNPPYQPGPGLDSKPVYEWAAGAGLDAVLDEDADMEPYLFPDGNSMAAVRAVADRYGSLNMRELPIAIALPEWNVWLPKVHPYDAFDLDAEVILSDPRGNLIDEPFFAFLYDETRADPTPEKLGNFLTETRRWYASSRSGAAANMRVKNTPVMRASKLPLPTDFSAEDERLDFVGLEHSRAGLLAWNSVKTWEIVHSNNLEEQGATQTTPVCAGGICVDPSEPRGWLIDGQSQVIFNRASHFVGYNIRQFTNQDRLVGIYEISAWYHLQLLLNTGYRNSEDMPSHFAYTIRYVDNISLASGQPESFRYWAGLIKQRQLQTNGHYGQEAGLDLRTAQPFWFYSTPQGQTDAREGVGATLWRNLAQASIEELLADAANARQEDWTTATNNSAVQLPDSMDISACDECFETTRRPSPFQVPGPHQGRNTYRTISKFREIGVEESVVQDLIDWSELMWPNGDWAALR